MIILLKLINDGTSSSFTDLNRKIKRGFLCYKNELKEMEADDYGDDNDVNDDNSEDDKFCIFNNQLKLMFLVYSLIEV